MEYAMNVRTLFLTACFALTSIAASAQNATFEKRAYGEIGSQFHADFNNDGREDFILSPATVDGTGFRVALSTGDGTYGAPMAVPGQKGMTGFAVGDFNQDGKADVIAIGGGHDFYTYYGHGDGTFSAPIDNVTSANVGAIAAGDFNHDGRVDLAFIADGGQGVGTLNIYFANRGGGWTVGPHLAGLYCCQLLQTGDFDGDGKADLLVEVHDMGTGLQILYGDNTGRFSIVSITDLNRGIYYEVRDANGDGISDLVGSDWVYTTNGQNLRPTMQIIYGHSGRTFSQQILTFTRCNNGMPAETADVNGDGLTDLIFVEESSCDGGNGDAVVATRNADGTYNAPQVVDSPGDEMFGVTVLRADRDTKPDVAAFYSAKGTPATDVLLNNTATGTFPGCAAPNAFRGISVCSPPTNGVTVASPITFSIGAATQTPGRKVELWIDGVKRSEQLKQQFSRYAYFDLKELPLENGNHSVTVYTAGIDNLLQKTSFTFYAGNRTGECAVPSASTAVVICFPENGSTVSTPVQVSARGGSAVTTMEVWVDGTKRIQNSGNSVESSLSLGGGTHKMTVYGRNSSGVVGKATSTFTVGGGTTCAQPSSATATVICSPQNGSTVSSPVNIQARGGSSVNFMEVWVDGTKRFQTSGNSVSTSLSLAAGTHHLSVFGKNGSTVLSKVVSDFTVQ
jgi:hypothetical protein